MLQERDDSSSQNICEDREPRGTISSQRVRKFLEVSDCLPSLYVDVDCTVSGWRIPLSHGVIMFIATHGNSQGSDIILL